jgi:hypothetical protein
MTRLTRLWFFLLIILTFYNFEFWIPKNSFQLIREFAR